MRVFLPAGQREVVPRCLMGVVPLVDLRVWLCAGCYLYWFPGSRSMGPAGQREVVSRCLMDVVPLIDLRVWLCMGCYLCQFPGSCSTGPSNISTTL
ncbi:hypothetical protein GW17_00034893 [Ensete ventricosum]|nr:hypothetical protein GW17_00034893 [Ensete ventricosum]RZS02867.1 hypothetical protein BHM03_00032980 [Ensete ventricosum]